MHLKRLLLAPLLLLLLGLSACSMLNNFQSLQQNNQILDEKAAVVGVLPELQWQHKDVMVVLLDKQQANAFVVARVQPSDDGLFTFKTARSGQFMVLAYSDSNHDGHYSAGEIWARSNVFSMQNRVQNITLTEQTDSPDKATQKLLRNLPAAERSLISAGKILDLSAPQFSATAAETGVWTSLKFINTYGMGTYFLQPWEDKKLPVILVNGFAGYPQQFDTLVPKLQASGYQPWVFNYPSGLSVDKAALILQLNIDALQQQYGFEHVAIVAHSVGGLLARETINLYAPRKSPVSVFVSLSTPWGGNEMAAKGVERAPTAIFAWHQIASNSDFINSLYEQPLPLDLQHYLMFSFNGRNRWLQGNSDGSVTIESQLHQPAQLGAQQMRGFNLGHVEILHDEAALTYVLESLKQGSHQALSH